MANPQSSIERLTDKQRQTVTDLLLAGHSCRSIGEQLNVSPSAVGRYKRRVVVPAVKVAAMTMPAYHPNKQVIQQAVESRPIREQAVEIAAASPFRHDLDRVRERLYGALERAESDPKTPAVALSPLFAQVHRNLELLGRVTGELEQRGGSSGSLQFMQVLMMPVGQPQPEPAKIVDAVPECGEDSQS